MQMNIIDTKHAGKNHLIAIVGAPYYRDQARETKPNNSDPVVSAFYAEYLYDCGLCMQSVLMIEGFICRVSLCLRALYAECSYD